MADLTIVILMVQFIAFFGALMFGGVARWIGIKPAVVISLAIWSGAGSDVRIGPR
jgi:MFS transporter, UMF1 family